ncbi:unnamed protein product [Mesocestoides corti]|uniref:Uncharacterized protein n=1 Tax=Mesocestoides corti TaxID=53468 RepID=A0A0R3UHK7_MESCO|nr:unnamed protein product [Mesocestoides corti]
MVLGYIPGSSITGDLDLEGLWAFCDLAIGDFPPGFINQLTPSSTRFHLCFQSPPEDAQSLAPSHSPDAA